MFRGALTHDFALLTLKTRWGPPAAHREDLGPPHWPGRLRFALVEKVEKFEKCWDLWLTVGHKSWGLVGARARNAGAVLF